MTGSDQIKHHMDLFLETTKQALEDMFGCEAKIMQSEPDMVHTWLMTDMPFSVRVQITGFVDGMLVSGEYIIATDERVAAAVCGVLTDNASSSEVEACREEFSDAFSELLNGVVGETVLDLSNLGRLKFSTPRMSFGRMSYGRLEICKKALSTSVGRIECLFHYDRSALE